MKKIESFPRQFIAPLVSGKELKAMRAKTYKCDDCGTCGEFSSYVLARAAGWAVSKDYKNCYCPACAPNHRRGNAANKQTCGTLPPGWEQLKIENL